MNPAANLSFAELAAAVTPPQPPSYRATCGRRRAFLSARDCAAYERGYGAWPAHPAETSGPAMTGFLDRDSEQLELDEEKREQAATWPSAGGRPLNPEFLGAAPARSCEDY
jgi:hypothetical protein